MKRGWFITLEGPDGCGKSTQAGILAERLKAAGYPVRLTREPGGTPLAEGFRRLILDPKNRVHPLTELFLYEASRAQHTEEVIRPALAEGIIVVSDRYSDATVAYQGYGRKIPLKTVTTLNQIAARGLKPHLTLLLEVSERSTRERTQGRRKDRMENEKVSFLARVRSGYRAIARKEPQRVKLVNGEGSAREVAERIWAVVRAKIGGKRV
ncbi:MAG: dTMP kinase [Elusimicrobia bacterium RIFCSPLOWO2_01_FULL_60_11]|nr:MAG: dTMP kinase [Elusimicrobia bacterium RIFCSPLOWO2_01_FULL_60_11]